MSTSEATTNGAAAGRVQEALGVIADDVEARVRDKLDEVRDLAADRASLAQLQVDDFVRTRPWEAVLFAAMGGLALGLLLRR